MNELNRAERRIWCSFLVLAGDSGKIQVASDEQLSKLLNVSIAVLQSAKEKMLQCDKITVNSEGIAINNWARYRKKEV